MALYTVGARKEIPGVRTYVSVDGGMADNIRPALYGAKYAARPIANGNARPAMAGSDPRADDDGSRITHRETVTIAGKFCESGDILIRDIELPRLEPRRSAGDPDGGRVHAGDGQQL